MNRIVIAAFVCLFSFGTFAQLPKTISFQGYLTNDAGEPITDGSLPLSFSLYDQVSDGNLVWGPEVQSVDVDRGIFSVILGSTDPMELDANLTFEDVYFLEIIVNPDGSSETLPRIRLTSSAYSLSNLNADNVTTNEIAVTQGGTGASDAVGARTNLGLVIGTDVQGQDDDLDDLADGTLSGSKVGSGISAANVTSGTLALANGGTGSSTEAGARTNLGLEIGLDVQAQDDDLDDLADGTLTGSKVGTGINAGNISSGSLDIAYGGTAATTAADARINLGLEIDSDVQAYDAGLASIANLTTSADRMIYTTLSDTYGVTTLTAFARNLLDDGGPGSARTTLGVDIGSDVMGYSSALASIASLTTVVDQLIYTTASDTYATSDITSFGRNIIAAADTDDFKTNLNLQTGSDLQAYNDALQSISGLTTSANQLIYTTASNTYATSSLTSFARGLLDDSNASTMRSTISAQASDAGLTSLAGLAPGGQSLVYATAEDTYSTASLTNTAINLLDDGSAAAMRSTIGAQQSDADLTDLADGSLTGTKVDPDFGSQTVTTTGNITTSGDMHVGATSAPSYTLEVAHGDSGPSSGDGLAITNGASDTWTFWTWATNNHLLLYYNNSLLGQFHAATGAYSTPSDIRVKKNINTMSNVLPKVLQLPIKEFHFKNQSDSELKNIGVIAQEVEKLFPSLVEYADIHDKYTVNYDGFGPLALKAIQEQQELIESLKSEVAELNQQLSVSQQSHSQLESKVLKQEQMINQLFQMISEKGNTGETSSTIISEK